MDEKKLKMMDLVLNKFEILMDDKPHPLEELKSAKSFLDGLGRILNDEMNKKIEAHPDSIKAKKIPGAKKMHSDAFEDEVERRVRVKFEKWLAEQRVADTAPIGKAQKKHI